MINRPRGAADSARRHHRGQTFARRAAGGRVVMIPMIGALTIGTKSPHSTTATPTTGHGHRRDDDPERQRRCDDPEARELQRRNRSSSFTTSTEPVIAPMPNAVKIEPRRAGATSCDVYARSGTAT